MKQIKRVDYQFHENGAIAKAIVQFQDGTSEAYSGSDQQKLIEIQIQLRDQSKQVLMEGK